MPPAIPGPKGLPIVGMLFEFQKGWQSYIQKVATFGDVVRVPFPFGDLIYVMHPDDVAHVLHHNQKNYWKGRQMAQGKPLFGEGLLLSEGDLWRRQRLRMAPAFTRARIDALAPRMAERIVETVGAWKADETRAISADMMALTLSVALDALFSAAAAQHIERVGSAFQIISDYVVRPAQFFGGLPTWIPTPANLRYNRAYADLQAVVDQILAERRARGVAGDDLLGLLLEGEDDAGERMDDRLLHDELRTLLVASHETTSLALTYSLWLLAGHPEIQEQVAGEALRVTDGQPVRAEHGAALSLTEGTLKESMRLYPPVPVLWRENYKEDTLGGYTIPPASNVIVGTIYTHRDARWFSDPDRFDPGRWTPEEEARRPRWSYYPFGGGARVCIGMGMAMTEARLALAEILRRFRVERVDPGELELVPSMTFRPSGPVHLRLHAR